MSSFPNPMIDPWYTRIYKLILITIFIYIPIMMVVLCMVGGLACCVLLPIIGTLWLCGVI